MDTPVVGRFAPSPSGRMHLGNLFSALLAWLSARSAGGRMLLRIEDLDPDRCRREFALQLMDDLRWLGLDWDGTPVWQSERTALYADAFSRLEGRGLLYPCFCTRAQRLAASAPHRDNGEPVYDGRCSRLSPAEQEVLSALRRPAWRLRVPDREIAFTDLCRGPYQENLLRDCGDFILRRSDGVYAYQLAVVVDDGLSGVTEVVRGSDLLSSTPRQRYLQELLGFPAPRYAHVPLLLSPGGRRLSKRDGDLDMGALRARFSPEELSGRLARLAGLQETNAPVSPRTLAGRFSWEMVPRADIVVQPETFG